MNTKDIYQMLFNGKDDFSETSADGRQSEQELREIIENADVAINLVNDQAVITYSNRAAQERDIIPREYIGKSLHDLKRMGLIIDPSAIKTLATGKTRVCEVTTYAGRSYMSITVPSKGEDGTVKNVFVVTFDFDQVVDFILSSMTRLIHYETEHPSNLALESESIVAESPVTKNILGVITRIAATDATALFLGESGVGKSAFAKFLHMRSERKNGKMITVNCGAIPENLMESELFGHEKGAFTGAVATKKGLFEEACGGTLFLDEIGELPLSLQVKLLSVLQDKKIRRVGGTKDINVDVRIIAATNKNLSQMVAEGKFRSDLFFRLNVFSVNIPPLRSRPEDLIKLIPAFLDKHNKQYGKSRYLSREAWHMLMELDWPGNVRELDNYIERLVVLSGNDNISVEDVELMTQKKYKGTHYHEQGKTLPEAVAELEKSMLTDARKKYGSVRKMAESLGIEFSSVARKMRKYGIV